MMIRNKKFFIKFVPHILPYLACLFCLACTPQEKAKQLAVKPSLGEQLFVANCTSCHSHTAENGIGPGLKDITKRRSKKWISAFIRNSTALIASGDKEAVAIYNKYNKTTMTSFSFSEPEMDSLYVYFKGL